MIILIYIKGLFPHGSIQSVHHCIPSKRKETMMSNRTDLITEIHQRQKLQAA
jgi:hypothetical protein